MGYRDDLGAKQQEAERIARELRDVRRQMNDIVSLSERERALEGALEAASVAVGRARAKVGLPVLSKLRVASPCHERWEEMTGDERVRHCGRCDKDVYDLSAMTAEAAEALLASRGQKLCVRFYRRADGTVMTADCPVGARKKRIRNTVLGVGAAAMSAFAGVAGLGAVSMGEPIPEPLMGEYVATPDEMNGPSALAPTPTGADTETDPTLDLAADTPSPAIDEPRDGL